MMALGRKRWVWVLLLVLVAITVTYAYRQPRSQEINSREAVPVIGETLAKPVVNPFRSRAGEESDRVYVMVDEKGREIMKTGMVIAPGDEYIDAGNRRYKVVRVKGFTAYARYVGQEEMPAVEEEDNNPSTARPGEVAPVQGRARSRIALYHTHSDESYVPTDGAASLWGKGGIFQVGRAMAERLRQKGYQVIHSTRPHDPHDASAYERSRRTAIELLRGSPVALIDVHRDATPPEVYRRVIDGQPVTGVKLVVGRQNPKMTANLNFAKRVKSVADKTKPGLVTGIFMASGDYNQDLSPRALLVEVGAHTNRREEAEQGARLFADVLPKAVGGATAQIGGRAGGTVNTPAPGREARGVWTALLVILGLAVGSAVVFLLVAAGGVRGAIKRLRHVRYVEFANFLGLRKREKQEQKGQDENSREG